MSNAPKKPKPAPDDTRAKLMQDLKAGLEATRAADPEYSRIITQATPAAVKLARLLAADAIAKMPPSEGGLARHDAAALMGVEGTSLQDAFLAWGRENTRLQRDTVADALRRVLVDILNRNADKLGAAVMDVLRPWAEQEANPEALAEWLDRGGWGKVDGDAVEARLVKAARAVAEADGLKAGLSAVLWPTRDAPYMVLCYDVPRSDLDTPAVRDRIAKHAKPELPAALLPEGWKVPDKATVLLGLDALKAGLQGFDWGGLGLCLTDKAGRAGDWLRLLVGPWLQETAERLEARNIKAVPLEMQRRNTIGTKAGPPFVRFPTTLQDAGAWCGALVPVDGDTIFAETPDLAAAPVRVLDKSEKKEPLKDATGAEVQLYQPRAWTIAPEHRLTGPRQPTLPGMLLQPENNPDLGAFLAVTATDAAALDLSGLSVKVLLALFGVCPMDGTPAKGPIENLAKIVYPDWKTRRKMQPSKKDPGDIRRTLAAVASLLSLRFAERTQGNLRMYPLLQADYLDIPMTPGAAPEVLIRLNKTLGERATIQKGKASFFLVNLSRFMELEARPADRLALALRFYAYWHTCTQRTADGRRVFMPDRLDYLPVDDLMIESNTAGRVSDLIAGERLGRSGKVKLSEARARIIDEYLPAYVAKGLLDMSFDVKRPDRHAGRGAGAWLIKIPPPADYLEAIKIVGRTGRTPPTKGRRKRLAPRNKG